ncbi:MAG: hypothetical protein WCK86_00605 [Planctomycetia bacterium]
MDSHSADANSPESSYSTPAEIRPRYRRRRALISGSLVLSLVASAVIVAPSVLMQTSASNILLGSAIGDHLSAQSAGAEGGWMAPLVFRKVVISDDVGGIECTIAELQTSKGLLQFLLGGSDVTQVALRDAVMTIHIGDDGQWPRFGSTQPSDSRLNVTIENGRLQLTVPWRVLPLVDLDRLNLTGRVGPNEQQRRVFSLDAAQIFDRTPLSEAHTEQNLALIAPILSQTTNLTGSASVWLDSVTIPLDNSGSGSPFPLGGRVVFHELNAQLRDTMASQLTVLLGQTSGMTLPDQIAVIRESRVNFEITDAGIHHDSMVFVLPQLAPDFEVASSGTLGLDETLDLQLEVRLPAVLGDDKPLLRLLSQASTTPLVLSVTGTVAKPIFGMPGGFSLLNSLARELDPGSEGEAKPSLPSAIGGLIQSARKPKGSNSAKSIAGSILNLIRATEKSKDDTTAKDRKSDGKASRDQ